MEPRTPTAAEKQELLEYLIEQGDIEASEADDTLFKGMIYAAVFDDYSTGGPGFFGKLMVIVWDGGPEQTQTYIWDRRALPGEEHTPWGQIDWHDGRHEPRIERVRIDVPEADEVA